MTKKSIKKAKSKGIHTCMRKVKASRKVLNAKTLEPCQQKNCMFFNGLCQPCKECGSKSKIIDIKCQTCFDCEYKPNSLRFDNNNGESKNKNDAAKNKVENSNPTMDKYKRAEEELALKQELMGIMLKLQDFENRNKDKGKSKGKKGEEEIEQYNSTPSYLG
jgi:hypothetical protein